MTEAEASDAARRVKVRKRSARLARMAKATIWGAKIHRDELEGSGTRWHAVMVTLTYAKAEAWQPNHVRDYLHRVRVYLKRKHTACRFVWVAELQQRGAVHYHVLYFLPLDTTLPKADMRGWWPHGATNVKAAPNAVGYMVKTAKQAKQSAREPSDDAHDYPQGCRIHGGGGFTPEGRTRRRWHIAPEYVRDYWSDWRADVVRVAGGGWQARATGEWKPSQWLVAAMSRTHYEVEETDP